MIEGQQVREEVGGREDKILPLPTDVISQKVFVKSFCKSRLPYKSVNLSLVITNIKNNLTDLFRI